MTHLRKTRARATAVLTALVLLALGFVLPPEKIVRVLSEERKNALPLRARFDVLLSDGDVRELMTELHPDRGVRLRDDAGSRWLLRDARLVGGDPASSDWIPELDVLLLRGEKALASWLRAKGISEEASHLARCGDADCFVIGDSGYARQLWVDKDRFEIRRFVGQGDRVVEMEEWAALDGVRFPALVRVSYGPQVVAEWRLRRLAIDRDLDHADFSTAWVRAAR